MHAHPNAGSLGVMLQLSDARFEPMFCDRRINRGDIATDLAIPLLAEGGWPAMTLAAVAGRGNMKRQSVAQWFGNVEAMREMVAWQYTRRWLRLLSAQLTPLYRERERGARPDATVVARLLLPENNDGIVFARIWLAICEAGRSDLSIAAATTYGESEQLAMVRDWLPGTDDSDIRGVCGLVTGLRAQLSATEPISIADAHASTVALRSRP